MSEKLNHLHKFNESNISKSEVEDVFNELIDDYNLSFYFDKLTQKDAFITGFSHLSYRLSKLLKMPYPVIYIHYDIYNIEFRNDIVPKSPHAIISDNGLSNISFESFEFFAALNNKVLNSMKRLISLFGGQILLIKVEKMPLTISAIYAIEKIRSNENSKI